MNYDSGIRLDDIVPVGSLGEDPLSKGERVDLEEAYRARCELFRDADRCTADSVVLTREDYSLTINC